MRIRWVEAALGFLLMASGGTIFVAFLLYESSPVGGIGTLLAAGGFLWAVLGSFVVVAEMARWRPHKQAPEPVFA